MLGIVSRPHTELVTSRPNNELTNSVVIVTSRPDLKTNLQIQCHSDLKTNLQVHNYTVDIFWSDCHFASGTYKIVIIAVDIYWVY